jgi:hypothetical protein
MTIKNDSINDFYEIYLEIGKGKSPSYPVREVYIGAEELLIKVGKLDIGEIVRFELEEYTSVTRTNIKTVTTYTVVEYDFINSKLVKDK